MTAIQRKVQDFLDQLRDSENPSSEEREKAVLLLTETLRDKNVYIAKRSQELKKIANDLQKARARLEEIHSKLDLSIKSGIVSNSIH